VGDHEAAAKAMMRVPVVSPRMLSVLTHAAVSLLRALATWGLGPQTSSKNRAARSQQCRVS